MNDKPKDEPLAILVAEDSEVDRIVLQEAFDELDFNIKLTFVGDGQELLDFLRQRIATDGTVPTQPALILMDLNMPRMKGIEALRELRADPALCVLPVIVLSTANSPKQIAQAYTNGVNSYITKPDQFNDYVDLLQKFGTFWVQSAKLPEVPVAL
jgi:CheY-like chemotaxis protein